MTDITTNSQYITGKPRESEELKSLIDQINALVQFELIDCAEDIEAQSSILTATGIWLDYYGARFNFPRPHFPPDSFVTFGFEGNGLGFDQAPFATGETANQPISDALYRKWIIARGGQLITDGTLPSLTDIVQTAFGDEAYYVDHGNMSMDVNITNNFTSQEVESIVEAGVIPKPCGVRVRVLYNDVGSDIFGFDGTGYSGFDQNPFITEFYL